MATPCTYCGAPLPKEDAKYCVRCGMLVPSHPFSAKSVSPANALETPGKTIAREQIAQQPPSRSGGKSLHDAPPWISQLDASPANPPRGTTDPAKRRQNLSPEQAKPNAQNPASARPLQVKIWDQPADTTGDTVGDNIEMLPTKPLATAQSGDGASSPARPRQSQHVDEVEQLDTVPLAAPSPALNRQTPWPSVEPDSAPQAHGQQSNLFAQTAQASNPASPFPAIAPAAQQPGQPRSQSTQHPSQPGLSRQPTIAARKHSVSRKKTGIIALITLAALVIIGAVAFVVVRQPFSIPTVTQPQQTFSSAQFSFSLHYPRGWQASSSASKRTTTFTDSSQTGQFIVMITSNSSNASQFLQQEANQLGMTNVLTNLPSLSFAGTSWQQIKGGVTISGAAYTETLLSAVHGSSIYTIMQLAPQATYAQEEQVVFSTMRSSFTFI